MKYLQSQASRYVHGARDTSNPTMAARFAMGRGGRRALRRYKRIGRRSAYKGNPAPAVVAAIASKLPAALGGVFKARSEKRAAGVVGAVVASAVGGNLTAAKAIFERQEIGLQKERAVWRAAWAQVPKKIKDALKTYAELVPGVDHGSPETAAESALARVIDIDDLEAERAAQTAELKAERRGAARETAAAAERREARLTELGAAGFQALARGGRRPRSRRRRRSTGRAFDF